MLDGTATFEIDGETVDAPAGTFVFVRPEARRKATGDATVLVLGATPGEAYQALDWGEAWPFHRDSMTAYGEQRYADALDAVRGGLERSPTTRGSTTTTRASRRSPARPATRRSTTSGDPSSCSRRSATKRAGTRTSLQCATTRGSRKLFAERAGEGSIAASCHRHGTTGWSRIGGLSSTRPGRTRLLRPLCRGRSAGSRCRVRVGRAAAPWLRAGRHDGCDASADMVDRCHDLASVKGSPRTCGSRRSTSLRRLAGYATIVVCGVFGLGSTRQQVKLALRRLHECLEPGGALVLDNQAPYALTRRWPSWTRAGRAELPEPWPPPGERARAADGSERELRVRSISLDPLDQTLVMEIRADKWVDDTNVASEVHALSMRMYFHAELLLLLDAAGFAVTAVDGDHQREPATADSDFLVYTAERR